MLDKKLKIRFFLWAILFLSVAWFLHQGLVPSGRIEYTNDFSVYNNFVQKLMPPDRVEGAGKVIGNPVYFSLATPRTFDRATIRIRYKNDSNLPLIELGPLVDKTVWRYDLKPVQNALLDSLAGKWKIIRENEVSLWQEKETYASLAEFLANPPENGKIAVYNYSFAPNFILPSYASSQPKIDLKNFRPLVGAWQAFVYLENEDLDLDLDFFDKNQNDEADALDFYLYLKDQLVYSRAVEDGRNGTDKEPFSASIKLSNLPRGAYKLELRANNDIVTDRIRTPQRKFAFINKIELAKIEEKPFVLYSDSQTLALTTIFPDRLQVVSSGQASLRILKTYQQFSLASSSGMVQPWHFEKDGVIVAVDGVLAFSEEAYVNPRIRRAVAPLDPAGTGLEYILARYDRPADSGGWLEQAVGVDLRTAYREAGKYSFLISIPGLEVDDGRFLEIGEIKVELEGRSLWEKLSSLLKK